MKLTTLLVAASATLFGYAGAQAITIEQVTRGHELIEKISAEKKTLDQIKADDCDDKKSWYAELRYWVKAQAVSDKCNPCAIPPGFYPSCNGCGVSGYDQNVRNVPLGLDRKHVIAAMQAQLDDDMAELNKLGITP